MKIRFEISAVVFGVGLIGIAALIADRTLAAREMLYSRAQTRAESIAESIARLAAPFLIGGKTAGPLATQSIALARLPGVAHVLIADRDGNIVFAEPKAGGGAQDDATNDGSAYLLEADAPITDPATQRYLGEVKVMISKSGFHESLMPLAVRGAKIGTIALFLLAAAAWLIGWIMGRRLESLVDAVEKLEVQGPLAVQVGRGDSEITRLARAFDALHERLLAEKARREKLESLKNDLTAMAVHDLRHPLTVLKAVLSTVSDFDWRGMPDGKKSAFLRMAARAIQRQDLMVGDLQQLARLDQADIPFKRKRINLGGLLADSAKENALIAEKFERPWRLEIDESLRSRWIYGDPGLLRRLIGNLVLNAADHSPTGTRITLGAKPHEKDVSKIEIYVQDEGKGVPPEVREAIFEKYKSFAESAKNFGLGLAFCRMVAEKHKARLEVASGSGRGARFILTLPTVRDQNAPGGRFNQESAAASAESMG